MADDPGLIAPSPGRHKSRPPQPGQIGAMRFNKGLISRGFGDGHMKAHIDFKQVQCIGMILDLADPLIDCAQLGKVRLGRMHESQLTTQLFKHQHHCDLIGQSLERRSYHNLAPRGAHGHQPLLRKNADRVAHGFAADTQFSGGVMLFQGVVRRQLAAQKVRAKLCGDFIRHILFRYLEATPDAMAKTVIKT